MNGTNILYVSVVTTRRSTDTKVRSVHVLKYGCEGPAKQLEWFVCKLSEKTTSDWTFNIMQISSFEYEAFLRRQKAEEVLA